MNRLIVVRHGQAAGNDQHRLIGWSTVPLEPGGVAEARATARRLQDVGADRVVSSDLVRTMETAAPIAEACGLPIEREPRIREIDNGAWTGLTPTEVDERWPELWGEYVSGTDVARPDGERWHDVRVRVREAFEELSAFDGTVVVVTHGGPVMLAAEWALGLDLPGNIFRGTMAPPENCSVTTIAGGRLLAYGDVGHLRSVPTFDVPYAPVRSVGETLVEGDAETREDANVAEPSP